MSGLWWSGELIHPNGTTPASRRSGGLERLRIVPVFAVDASSQPAGSDAVTIIGQAHKKR